MEINKDKLTFHGSMNYILQAFRYKDEESNESHITLHNYMPRKNRGCELEEQSKEEAKLQIEETIERMKIAINLFEQFLEGKIDSVYYWELQKEPYQD